MPKHFQHTQKSPTEIAEPAQLSKTSSVQLLQPPNADPGEHSLPGL